MYVYIYIYMYNIYIYIYIYLSACSCFAQPSSEPALALVRSHTRPFRRDLRLMGRSNFEFRCVGLASARCGREDFATRVAGGNPGMHFRRIAACFEIYSHDADDHGKRGMTTVS